MHPLLVMAVAAGTFLATLGGGLLALKWSRQLHLMLGFSAGAVLAVAFFDLLPEALRLARAPAEGTLAVAALGFFAYTVFDRLLPGHGSEPSLARGFAGAATLSAHSVMDGLAIGFAFQASLGVGAVVAVAVLAHDWADGMNTVNVVVRHTRSRAQAIGWLLVDAVAPVAGAGASLIVRLAEQRLAMVLALFAGFFLCIGASDLLPESFHARPSIATTLATLAGAALIFIVVRLAG